MIAKATGGGNFEVNLVAGLIGLAPLVAAGIWVGVHVNTITATAEEVKEIKATLASANGSVLGRVDTIDRRLVQVETSLHAVQSQQVNMQRSLQQTREEQAGIKADVDNVEKKIDAIQAGINEIQRLLRARQ